VGEVDERDDRPSEGPASEHIDDVVLAGVQRA
jgi:hypothetical protein